MNTTPLRAMRRLATGLGAAALTAAAALGLGAATATADRGVCECANGKHVPHFTVPGLRDDFNPQPEPPGRDHRGDGSDTDGPGVDYSTSGGGAGRNLLSILGDGFNPQPEPPGRHGSLTANHSLTIARMRRAVGH